MKRLYELAYAVDWPGGGWVVSVDKGGITLAAWDGKRVIHLSPDEIANLAADLTALSVELDRLRGIGSGGVPRDPVEGP